MDEFFLKHNYLVLTYTVEVLAALTGIFLFKKYKNTNSKYFILFLIYLTICDWLGAYTTYVHEGRFLSFFIGTVFEKNFWWSTLFWKIGAIVFFAFYYQKVLIYKRFKKVLKWSNYFFVIFSIIYIIINWEDYFTRFFPVIDILGAIIIFMCSVFYFIEILQSETTLTFYKSLNFYISAAIFIWWLIITPIVFYDIYFTYDLKNSYKDLNFVFLRSQIYLFANIFMYSTFTFALIFCKPENDDMLIENK
jgi:hypothetical protein